MNPVAEHLAASAAARRHVILDGAMATELEARGADLRDPLWSAKILIETACAGEFIKCIWITLRRARMSLPPQPIRRASRGSPGAALIQAAPPH